MQKASARLGLQAVRKSFVFSGRSTRTEAASYLLLMIVIMLAWVAAFLLLWLIGIGFSGASAEWLELAFVLLLLVPSLGLLLRRLNDQNRSRWWALAWPLALASRIANEAAEEKVPLLGLAPGELDLFGQIGLVPLVVLLCLAGVEGVNGHGPDPRAADA